MRGEESVWLVFTVLYPLCKKSQNSKRASNIKIISGKKNKTALLYNEDIKGDKTSLEHSLSSKASQRICEFCLKQWRESLPFKRAFVSEWIIITNTLHIYNHQTGFQ